MKIVNPLSIKPQMQNIMTLCSRTWGKSAIFVTTAITGLVGITSYLVDFATYHLSDSLIIRGVAHNVVVGLGIYILLVTFGYTAYRSTFEEVNQPLCKSEGRLAYDDKIKSLMFRVGMWSFVVCMVLDGMMGFKTYATDYSMDLTGLSNPRISILIGSLIFGYMTIKWITMSMILYVLSYNKVPKKITISLADAYYKKLGKYAKSDLRIGMILFGCIDYLIIAYTKINEIILIPFIFIWCLSVIIPQCCHGK